MPVVACPKCSTPLKIPDGASGNVKCPKCNTIFPVAAPPAAVKPAPAFEVVEDAPAKPARKAVAKPEVLEPDFEVVDEPKPKKKAVVVEIDDEDDRPRGKRRRDEDDEDARPRKKKRRDYDEDDDWRPASGGGSFGSAKVGMLLVSISLWMYVGTFALLACFLLLGWLGAGIPSALMIITGLLGLANWIVALVGLGFCIAGPSQSRGLAIAATAVAAVHLVMAFVVANNEKSVNPATFAVGIASASGKADRAKSLMEKIQKETDPRRQQQYQKELQELFDSATSLMEKKSEMRWPDLATLMPFSDILVANLAYESKDFSDYVLGLLSGLLEVARAILLILLIGSVGNAARDRHVGQQGMVGTIAFSVGTGVALLVWLIVRVIVEESKPSATSTSSGSSRGGIDWLIAGALIVYLIHLGTLVLPALNSLGAKDAAARRAR